MVRDHIGLAIATFLTTTASGATPVSRGSMALDWSVPHNKLNQHDKYGL
jgi:hypothetical protein